MTTTHLLLGPSLGTSARVWSKVESLLPPGIAVTHVELPGHGAQPPATAPLSVAALADQVVAVADTIGTHRFHYAGISLSGAIALDLGLRYPDRLASLTVVCSAAKIGESAAWIERAEQVRQQGTAVLVEGAAQRWFAPGFVAKEPEIAGRLLRDLWDTDAASYAYLCDALAQFDLRDRLAAIAVPTLILSGAHDIVTPPAEGRFLATQIPGATYQTIEDAAHLAPIEQPEQVAQAMVRFLEEQRA